MTNLAGHHFIPKSTGDVKVKEGEKGRLDSILQDTMIPD
jgi:hypothetical protein